MRALVTGAGGFVGKEVVRNLLSNGYSVNALIRNKSQAPELEALGAQPILGDLLNKDSLKIATQGTDVIFHIGALFRQAGLPDSEFFNVNVNGTKNVLEAGIAEGVTKFIHCSTVGVHGNIEVTPGIETSPFAPGDPYQKSKLEGELLVSEYFKSGKISGAIIRPAMIYGPRDTRTLKLFKKISEKRFFYVGSGDALVHFIDVRDLAEAFRLTAEKPEANGETFIISGKTSLPLNKLVSIIAALFGVEEPKLHLPVKPMQMIGSICEAICTPLKLNPPIFRRRVDFFTKNRCFDSAKAIRILGFHPKKSLVEEIIDIIDSYLESGMISHTGVNKPASILRTIEGEIRLFDETAEKFYGWGKAKIIGQKTHDIFSTIFPDALDNINSNLIKSGVWRGDLLHKTKNNHPITVDSKWLVVPNCNSNNKMVLEVNKLKNISRMQRSNFLYFFNPELLELLAI